MIGHDPGQSCLGDAVGPAIPTVRWTVVSDLGRYVTVDGQDGVLAGSNLSRYDAYGHLLWTANTPLIARRYEAPIVNGSAVLVPDYQQALGLRGLDSLDLNSGAVTTLATQHYPITSGGPALVVGQLYFAGTSDTGGPVTLMATSPGGSPSWSANLGAPVDAAEDASGNSYAVDPLAATLNRYSSTGSVVWTQSLGTNTFPGSVLVDSTGAVFVTYNTGSVQVVQRINPADGTILWTTNFPSIISVDYHLAAFSDGGVYTVIITGAPQQTALVKVSATGIVDWTVNIDGTYPSPSGLLPTFLWMVVDSAGTAYVPVNSKLVAVSSAGVVAWTAPVDATWGLALSHDGTLYALGGSTLYAIGGDPCGAGSGGGSTTIARVAVKSTATPVPYWTSQLKGTEAVLAAPNPAADKVQVAFRLRQAGHAKLLVMDLLGDTVRTVDLGVLPPGDALRPMETRGLASGLYVLILIRDSGDGPRPVAHFKLAVLH